MLTSRRTPRVTAPTAARGDGPAPGPAAVQPDGRGAAPALHLLAGGAPGGAGLQGRRGLRKAQVGARTGAHAWACLCDATLRSRTRALGMTTNGTASDVCRDDVSCVFTAVRPAGRRPSTWSGRRGSRGWRVEEGPRRMPTDYKARVGWWTQMGRREGRVVLMLEMAGSSVARCVWMCSA